MDRYSSPRPLTRRVAAEASALVVLVSLGVLAVWHLVRTPRSWMLFEDGDSVLLAIVRRALEGGLPDDFRYSPVLFVPEQLLYDTIGLLTGATAQQALAVNAVVNVVLFGLAARFAVAPVLRTRSVWLRAASAILPAVILTVAVVTESSRDRDSFELASLQLLTTYYSATTWATLVLLGLLLRSVLQSSTRHRVATTALACVVAGLSVWSNPMVLAWVALPALMVVGLMATRWWRARVEGTGVLRMIVADLIGPAVILLAAGTTMVIRKEVALTGTERLEPGRIGPTFEQLAARSVDRLGSLAGLFEVALWAAVVVTCAAAMVVVAKRRTSGPGAVALLATGTLAPFYFVVFTILGAPFPRYLQPMFFLPVVAVVVAVEALVRARRPIHGATRGRRRPVTPGRPRLLVTALAALVLTSVPTAALVAVPDVARAASQVHPDVQCVVDWVSETDRPGAGDFWTIRGVKYRIPDQGQIVQVLGSLQATTWLVNRHDVDSIERVSWVLVMQEGTFVPAPNVISSVESVPTLPGAGAPELTRCGSLTIADWGKPVVPIGAADEPVR